MRQAIVAQAQAWLTLAVLIGVVCLIGWHVGRKDRPSETPVTPLDPYRKRLEDDARAQRRTFVRRVRKHQSARAKLMQFHTGGNGAA